MKSIVNYDKYLDISLSDGRKEKKIEEKIYKVWISLIDNLGIKRYQKLIQSFGSREQLWKAKKEQLKKIEGIGEKLSQVISSEEIKKDVLRHLKYMEEHHIDIISIEDKEYPLILKQIDNPPLNLYIRGNKKSLEMPAIAIVGCRDATEYGKNVAQNFSYMLAKNGMCIISGLARGIDSFAHFGAVKANKIQLTNNISENNVKLCKMSNDEKLIVNINNVNLNGKTNNEVLNANINNRNLIRKIENENVIGKTVAILGNGLDTIYPTENTNLAGKILNTGGAIISEYPLGTRTKKGKFSC